MSAGNQVWKHKLIKEKSYGWFSGFIIIIITMTNLCVLQMLIYATLTLKSFYLKVKYVIILMHILTYFHTNHITFNRKEKKQGGIIQQIGCCQETR